MTARLNSPRNGSATIHAHTALLRASARDDRRLNALASVAGDAFDVEYRDRPEPSIVAAISVSVHRSLHYSRRFTFRATLYFSLPLSVCTDSSVLRTAPPSGQSCSSEW
jgi:hypothetical protein